LEYWRIGVLEYWSIGVLEDWRIGGLEDWRIPNREPEDERDDGKENAYLGNKHTPPNDAGEGDDDNIEAVMQEEV
jgi:hypothetical protein